MSKAREWPGVGICSAVAQGAGGGGWAQVELTDALGLGDIFNAIKY